MMVERLLLSYMLVVSQRIMSLVFLDRVAFESNHLRICLKGITKSLSSLCLFFNHIWNIISHKVQSFACHLLMSIRFRRIDAVSGESFKRLSQVVRDLGRLNINVPIIVILMLAYDLMANRSISSIEPLVAVFTVERPKSLLNNFESYLCLRCLRRWSFMLPLVVNVLWHTWQVNGFSLVCILKCILRFGFSVNTLLHPG